MKYVVEVMTGPYSGTEPLSLRRAALAALDHQAASPGNLTLALVDEAQIQELNLRFRGLDEPTDVLSFQDGSLDPETRRIHFGDVVVAVPVARRSAVDAGHSLEAELALLAVHGVLHLLGHDHEQPDEKARMWQAQAEVLKTLGLEANP